MLFGLRREGACSTLTGGVGDEKKPRGLDARRTVKKTPTRFSEVPRARRVALAAGDVAGFEVQRFGRRWLLFVWERGEHGCPLIGASLTPEERALLIRLLGGEPR